MMVQSSSEIAIFISIYIQELDRIEAKTRTFLRVQEEWKPPIRVGSKVIFDAAYDCQL